MRQVDLFVLVDKVLTDVCPVRPLCKRRRRRLQTAFLSIVVSKDFGARSRAYGSRTRTKVSRTRTWLSMTRKDQDKRIRTCSLPKIRRGLCGTYWRSCAGQCL